MLGRILSIVIGYLFGCFLTAEIVARKFAGKPVSEIGETGNPGMANIMINLGFVPGIITLLGDLVKCLIAMTVSYLLFHRTGWIVTLYAGLGCTLGHDFPCWRGFRGGKGVAVSSAAFIIYSPLWGLLANLAGMLVAIFTKHLNIAGPVIPLFFMLFLFLKGDVEAGILGAVFSALSIWCNLPTILGIFNGTTSKTDVIGAIRKKFQKK